MPEDFLQTLRLLLPCHAPPSLSSHAAFPEWGLASPDQRDPGGRSAGKAGVSSGLEERHAMYSWKSSWEGDGEGFSGLSQVSLQERSPRADVHPWKPTGTTWET